MSDPVTNIFYVVTYIPADMADDFLEEVTSQIPKLFGNYDRVAWHCETGTEQFRPLEGANPTKGSIGKTERAQSVRLEFCLPHDEAAANLMVKDVIRPAHPYEEPVILIFEGKMAKPPPQ